MPTDSFIIKGLAGKKSLKGEVSINGAKNAALKAMAASVLFDGQVTLKNIPDTEDIKTLCEIIKNLGAKVDWNKEDKRIQIDPTNINSTNIDVALAKSMRASVVLTGPLLARFGKASFPSPGGCVIGERPIDIFIDGYKKFGASVLLDDKKCAYVIKAPIARAGGNNLKAAEIKFRKITVTGTETMMMTATLLEGKTVLTNCALEPEIASIAEWLDSCGAKISGAGTPTIAIEGTGGKLLSPKTDYVTIPDRIEAGSFLILGALCATGLVIKDCEPKHLEATIDLLKKSGVPIETGSKEIRIMSNTKPNSALKAFNVHTKEFPGFPTDLQAPIVVYLTQVDGETSVVENIFESRFKYVDDLVRMGADISVMSSNEVVVTKEPVMLHPPLASQKLEAHDIRAGFAIVLAALCGKGEFNIGNIRLIDRGYERLEERLQKLGASIERKIGGE